MRFNPAYSTTPHITVPLGIDCALESATPAPAGPPVTLMISRLEKSEDYKGHRELIQAWPQVLRKIPTAELRIIGTGNLKEELVTQVRQLGLEQQIHLLGWVEEEQKQALLEKCMCLALPSRAEGFGLVYLEAMRIGRPCLVSVFDAAREVVNPPEAGLAVDPAKSHDLVEALCRLLRAGTEWELWSAQSRHRYEALFTAHSFQQRLVQAIFKQAA
ncbi:MAG: glycosyltransferase family 4 protein [Acidobacteria bacterium]|nr:glycosyltransferase family 4 protein [Acidobacteriota bacterium]MBI3425573.1 glycosyltransferase family 4 protein [Acidobacteriota bacterium]